eukprot:2324932-Rhodomonas_salina.1
MIPSGVWNSTLEEGIVEGGNGPMPMMVLGIVTLPMPLKMFAIASGGGVLARLYGRVVQGYA